MWAFRVVLEKISQIRYREMDLNCDFKEKMHNCQILHYTRRNPETEELSVFINNKKGIVFFNSKTKIDLV
jgi:hypothetical protein